MRNVRLESQERRKKKIGLLQRELHFTQVITDRLGEKMRWCVMNVRLGVSGATEEEDWPAAARAHIYMFMSTLVVICIRRIICIVLRIIFIFFRYFTRVSFHLCIDYYLLFIIDDCSLG